MIPQPPFRKILQGVATRRQMFQLFDRHGHAPMSKARITGRLYDGEWFEIGRSEHDYMFDILPPLWMRGDAFAMREFMAGPITSVFFSCLIDGRMRYFHAYCDMTAEGSVDAMRRAITERSAAPAPEITRAEQLEHIWSTTPSDLRGWTGDGRCETARDKRTILVVNDPRGTFLTLLEDLSDAEIAARMPLGAEPMAA